MAIFASSVRLTKVCGLWGKSCAESNTACMGNFTVSVSFFARVTTPSFVLHVTHPSDPRGAITLEMGHICSCVKSIRDITDPPAQNLGEFRGESMQI